MKTIYKDNRIFGLRISLRFLLCIFAFLLGCINDSMAQTLYTWAGTTGSNWSTPGDWSPSTSTAGPTTLDTANLNNVTSNTIAVYDTGASGTLSTLNFTQTSNYLNELRLEKNLTITNAVTLAASGGSSAKSEIYVDSQALGSALTLALSGGITLNSGGLLNVAGVTGATNSIVGNISIAGGTFQAERGLTSGTSTTSVTGTVMMSSGNIILGQFPPENSGTGGASTSNLLSISGNLTTTGGTINNANAGTLVLSGATNSITGTTLTHPVGLSLANTGAQSFSTDTAWSGSILFRAGGNTTKTFSDSASGGNLGAVTLLQSNVNSTTTWALGSNLTLISGAALPTAANFSGPGSGTVSFAIDTENLTLDLSTGATGLFAPNQETGSTTNWTLENLAASPTNGIIKAQGFNFNTASTNTAVNANVTLQAVTGGDANVLSTPGAATINPGSIFLYTGTGTASTLASTRNLGALTVGDGTNVSTLQLISGITTAGSTQASASSTLDLNGNNLVVGVSGSGVAAPVLTGTGTLQNSSTTTASTVSFASGASAGLNVTGGTTTTGIMSANPGTKGLILNFANAGLTFNLNSGSSSNTGNTAGNASDQISFSSVAGTTGLTFSSNTVSFNDLTASHGLGTGLYTLFSLTGGTSGNFMGLTLSGTSDGNGGFAINSGLMIGTGLAYYTTTLGDIAQLQLNSIGGAEDLQLDISAVPEPSTWMMIMMGSMGLLVWHYRRNIRSHSVL